MAVDGSLMFTLFQIIVVFLDFLTYLHLQCPNCNHYCTRRFSLSFFLYLLTTVVFPFGRTYVNLFDSLPEPFAKLLIGSAILFYVSELISQHIEEAGYASLASMSHFAVKIAILTLWIDQTAELIDVLSSLITK